MASAIGYTLYVGITGQRHGILWVAFVLILLEIAALLLNRWRCPLSDLAVRYTEERQHNFDIYLPEWLAKHNKTIFGTILIVALLLIILRATAIGWE